MPRTTDAPGEADLARLEALLRHAGPEDLGGWEEVGPLVAEVRRLRAELAEARPVVAAAEAHRAAYVAWHDWRPAAGMGHGHADRYAETREALLAALAARDSGEGEGK